MSALTEFFFRYPDRATSSWSIVNWWESRRLVYNASVGIAGAASITAIELAAALPPDSFHVPIPWIAIGVYALLANLCYTAGPIAELFIRWIWGGDLEAVGPALFRYGFAFSIGLTLLPTGLAMLAWVAKLSGVLS